MPDLRLGYSVPDADEVSIPVFHTVTTGITRHGKSETKKALAERARDAGYTLLVFDTKTPRDYGGVGVDIPIYLEEHTNPTILKGLLENQSGMSLSFQYSELIKMYEPGDTYHDILTRIRETMDEDVHPVEEDKLRVLEHLLSALATELDRVDVSDGLELTEGAINVMDLHAVEDSIQQLAIAGSIQQVLDGRTDTIVVLDEAHNFIPQGKQPPARDPLVKLIREGGAGNNWLWISDQTITGVDKDPLKQVGVWILGKQREKNEAKRVLDQIPGSTSYGKDDVMTLEKGHFIVALDDAQPHVYVQPKWLDKQTARAVARGEQSPDDVEPQGPATEQPTTTTNEDTMTEQEREEYEEQLREKEARIERLEAEKEELEAKIDDLFGDLERAREQEMEPLEAVGSGVDEERVRELLEEFVHEVEVPEGVTVRSEVPAIEVRREVSALTLEDSTIQGKAAILYANGAFPEDEWFTTGDLDAMFDSYGWTENVRRTDVLDTFCQWGYLERRYTDRREYRLKLTPEEAKERGLLTVEETVA